MSVPNLYLNHIEYQLSQISRQILGKANLSIIPYMLQESSQSPRRTCR